MHPASRPSDKPPQLTDRTISRRQLLSSLAACGVAIPWASALSAKDPAAANQRPIVSANESLRLLKEGNRRFVEDRTKHDHSGGAWRNGLVDGQHPFAVVVGCADSRVPPELIFDQGFGDLFVIRNAGNLIATDVLASVEYAMVHLDCRLVVIMGHEGCGAVTAALMNREQREREPLELQATLRMIEVALSGSELEAYGEERVTSAVEANVRFGIKQLKYLAAERKTLENHPAQCVGAIYGLRSGAVRFLQ